MRKYTQEFVEKQFENRGSKLLSEYKASNLKLDVICSEGHFTHPKFSNFINSNGNGCGHPECKNKRIAKSNSLSYEEVRDKINVDDILISKE
jgi:hypothetical protein